MVRTVEGAMNRALDAIVSLENPRTSVLPGEVFLLEPRINEMKLSSMSMRSDCSVAARFQMTRCGSLSPP